jgi:hypothetical protein
MPLDESDLEAKEKMGGNTPLSDKVAFHPFLALPCIGNCNARQTNVGDSFHMGHRAALKGPKTNVQSWAVCDTCDMAVFGSHA